MIYNYSYLNTFDMYAQVYISSPLPEPGSQQWVDLSGLGDQYSEKVQVPSALQLVSQVTSSPADGAAMSTAVRLVDSQVTYCLPLSY